MPAAGGLAPRILVGTIFSTSRLHALSRWAEGLRNQDTDLRWDVLLAAPAPAVTPHLHRWVRSEPFGSYHRLRLRSPEDEDAAARLLVGKLSAWQSYEALLMLDLDVWLPPTTLRNLHEADVAWAVATSSLDRVPLAPLSCALLKREAVEHPSSDLHPTYVPGARWERISPPEPNLEAEVL